MRKSMLVLVLFAPFACGQTLTYTYSGLPQPIYPSAGNTWTTIKLTVPKSITVSNVTVSVQAQYSPLGDINLSLWSPSGTRVKLLERNCGQVANIDTTFDDAAPSKFKDICPAPGSNPYEGNELLSKLNGENAFGYWQLGIENVGSSNTGLLTGFTLNVTGTSLATPTIGPNTIVSTSSFEGGAIAPGDHISILGVSLGPAGGIEADATKPLPTSLGPTTVLFDGFAAPLFYASATVVEAQVPTKLTPGVTTKIQIRSASGTSPAMTFPVVTTKPGIFTHQSDGQGQARAINSDGSVNGDGSITGSDKPASPGTVIEVYATGLGPVSASVDPGTPSPSDPLSTLTLPISATIGGRSAMVTWAGAAPTQIGVYQVNILIPVLTPTGAAPVILSVGGNTSQHGVTVQIQ